MVNVFLLVPESKPTTPWSLSNESFQDEKQFSLFVNDLKTKIASFQIENYEGFYDLNNVINFLKDFKDLEEYYPKPAFRLFKSSLKNWSNWANQTQCLPHDEYKIFNQKISNHTFCEITARKLNDKHTNFSILNHNGHNLGNHIKFSINNEIVNISSFSTKLEVLDWFSINRIPKRNFNLNPKHGENRQDERIINGELISPLKCSKENAQIMLNRAIGYKLDELFYFDKSKNNILIFKSEGNSPQNTYHGFHVPLNSQELPNNIKIKFIL